MGSAKTDPVRFKKGFLKRDFWKTNLPFFWGQLSLTKVLFLKTEKLLAKRPFFWQKRPCFERPLNSTGSFFHSWFKNVKRCNCNCIFQNWFQNNSRVERGAGPLRRQMRILILEVVSGAPTSISPPPEFWGRSLRKIRKWGKKTSPEMNRKGVGVFYDEGAQQSLHISI